MKETPPRKRLEDALLTLARTQSKSSVFDDFLDFSLRFIRWWDVKPEHFRELELKYPGEGKAQLFAEAYLAMGDIADDNGRGFKDPFGEFFETHLSSHATGQFFTPETVCDFMAQIEIDKDLPDNATIGDPCCGSGRLLMSAAKINRKAIFYAADIDLRCCRMTVLNFLLNTMCGEVYWMNSLSGEVWRTWKIGKVLADNGYYMPYYIETKGGVSRFTPPHRETEVATKPSSQEKTTPTHKPPKKKKETLKSRLILDLDIS